MNRQYMDFVPAKPAERKVSANPGRVVRETRTVRETRVVYKAVPEKKVSSPNVKPAEPVVKPAVVRAGVVAGTRTVATTNVGANSVANTNVVSSGFSIKNEPKLGVVEDLQPKFVKTEVEKRPLSDGKALDKKAVAKEAKSKRIGLRRKAKQAEKAEKKIEKVEVKDENHVFKTPKTPFINQDKVVKRPLSKNVYTKKVEEPKGEPEGTVTIIAKPKKERHAGLVVAIIITIILGAAAGTVAFLLLPK